MEDSLVKSSWEGSVNKSYFEQLSALSMLPTSCSGQIITQIEGLVRSFLWQGGNNGGEKNLLWSVGK